MFQRAIIGAVCVFLAGCGNPLARLDRFSDVDLAQEDPVVAALPSADEIARDGYFGTETAEGVVPQGIALPPQKRRGGLFSRLRRDAPKDREAEAIAASVAASESEVVPEVAAEQTEVAALAPSAQSAPKRRGVLGRFLPRGREKPVAQAAPEPSEEEVTLAAASPAPEGAIEPRRRGWFGRLRTKPETAEKPRTGPDAQEAEYGTVLAFGEVARVCAALGQPLGQVVETATAKGYQLHDSAAHSDDARTYYITGFSDGCPRQLTAANVLFGAASTYEQFHYGPGGEHLPKGETDVAYERVKRRVCSAGRGRPCGSQMRKLERSTFFVTAYGSSENANRWTELLIHDGEVLAAEIKSSE